MYEKHVWLSQTDLSQLHSSSYWNDVEVEKEKIWSKVDTDFAGLEQNFARKRIKEQFDTMIKVGSTQKGEALTGISLGSGICILEAQILRDYPLIGSCCCVEFSRHRIHEIAPQVLMKYSIEPSRAPLCFGSFYEIPLPDASMDFVLLSQAFHHAQEPMRLLSEVRRLIHDEGVVYIIGEHFFPWREVVIRAMKHVPKWIFNHRGYRGAVRLLPNWHSLVPNDLVKGDHHYRLHEYARMFTDAGFSNRRFIFREVCNQGYLLKKL